MYAFHNKATMKCCMKYLKNNSNSFILGDIYVFKA